MAKIVICFYLTNDLTKSYQVIHTMESRELHYPYNIYAQAPTRHESVGAQ